MGVVDDAVASAEWMAAALRSSGYQADFTPSSLWEIDRFFDDQTENGEARSDGLLVTSLGQRLFGIGAYVGEVIRRTLNGRWQGDDGGESAEINVAVVFVNGTMIWPVQRVIKRFEFGEEDGIAAYGTALGLPVGPGSQC